MICTEIKSSASLILFLVLAVTWITPGLGQEPMDLKEKLIQEYLGEWVNTDPNSKNVTRLVIENSGKLTVRAFGKCAPKDCELGEVELFLISDSVDNEANLLPFNYAMAIWHLDYAEHVMRLKVRNSQLLIENTGVFKDNSGRNNYSFSAIFKKVN
ncbi:MAG: hypothetical protein CML04_02150 [Pseudozobellia sp.]|nr:hypothetical protein [Pseudozobellia sp.]MBG50307.1 hypothetical protein [Pseudozobellia sp.]|tara:strand:+ start:3440 stop:3907 length:468 start_codon:yes stop_codon:yes gene_type:complete